MVRPCEVALQNAACRAAAAAALGYAVAAVVLASLAEEAVPHRAAVLHPTYDEVVLLEEEALEEVRHLDGEGAVLAGNEAVASAASSAALGS